MARIFYFIILSFILFWGCIPPPSQPPTQDVLSVRVLLAEISNMDSMLFGDDYSLKSEEALYDFGSSNRKIYINPLKNGIQIFNANRNLIYKNEFPIVIQPVAQTAKFVFRNIPYRGSVIFEQATPSSIYLINKLPLEDYLKGVVPFEIISTKENYYQAVKAQAICARTYAYDRIVNPRSKMFDLYGSVMDQVYSGYSNKYPLANRAVDETRNTILLYEGQPAKIFYHSTCGGSLESPDKVWDTGEIPFLKARKDIIGEQFACRASPKFRWQEYRTLEQLDSSFALMFNIQPLKKNPEDTLNINMRLKILNRTNSGRIDSLLLSHRDTTVILCGNLIRKFFAWPPGGYLWSNLFTIHQASDTTIVLNGGGYGHGVGLCQYGAMQMAADGYQYFSILIHYFPDIILGKINQLQERNERPL